MYTIFINWKLVSQAEHDSLYIKIYILKRELSKVKSG